VTEQQLIKQILLMHSHQGRLFRNNVAKAWVGDVIAQTSSYITLQNYRRLHAGLAVGSSDLIGWTSQNGQAIFTAVEVKAGRTRTTKQQQAFVDTVNCKGGLGLIVRSCDDYTRGISGL